MGTVLAASGCGAGSDGAEALSTRRGEATSSAAPAATLPTELTDRLDRTIEQAMIDAAIPGAVIGIRGPRGDYVRAFGVADKKTRAPMKVDVFTRIGSQTKTFTVTAVLRLADQGRLGLDDPISGFVSGVPRGDEITLRELARMQSGLANYTNHPQFVRDLYSDPQRRFTPQELLDFAFSQPASFAPGDGFEYSNTNTVLLGLVVESVTGRPLADHLRDHVSGPLGMSDTTLPSDSEFPKPHAAGYTRQSLDGGETTATDWNPSWAWAAGAMISTLHDMQIWAPALANGALLTREMQQQRLQTVDRFGDPAPTGYGLGVFNLGGWIGHNGSLPGYQTVSVFLPEEQTSLVLFVNTDIPVDGADPGTVLATAVTTELSPGHVYAMGD
ncbi:serine hydrolase domain-containing protein [Mycolicibacterium parafortuitum]|nr:serine hydrolase [Mycolicibacterium parafortuitum]